jgi:hypothetical protein
LCFAALVAFVTQKLKLGPLLLVLKLPPWSLQRLVLAMPWLALRPRLPTGLLLQQMQRC